MTVKYVNLGDVCSKGSSNIAQKDLDAHTGEYPIYGASGYIKSVDFYQQEDEYIGIVKDGAGVGRAMILPSKSSVIGTLQYIIPDKRKVNIRYLYYAIVNMELGRYFSGATIPHIYFKDYQREKFKLPDLEAQKNIANNLVNIDSIISKKRTQINLIDELVKSRFIEMFGDMFLNTMNWPEVKLNSIADIVSGITKGRKIKEDKLFEVPYMAVSNVKDGYIDWTTVKTILATSTEIKQYRLMSEDVLMTEGGDPDKLGRGAIIHNPPKDCIHQNHIFRVRLKQNFLLPEYMEQYLQHQRSKIYFLKCAKQTTGIASINMRQLSALPILMPPIELQNEFTSFIGQTNKSKFVNYKYCQAATNTYRLEWMRCQTSNF